MMQWPCIKREQKATRKGLPLYDGGILCEREHHVFVPLNSIPPPTLISAPHLVIRRLRGGDGGQDGNVAVPGRCNNGIGSLIFRRTTRFLM